MKKILIYVAVVAVTITFYGCPVSVNYPLGITGTEKIDNGLIGTWQAEGNPDDLTVVKVKIARKDDFSYDVTILESGGAYMEEVNNYTGWVTELDGYKFIFFLGEGSTDSYYLYEYKMDGKKKFVSHDVGLLVGGVDAVTSIDNYRDEVSASLKKPECLSEETVWNKIDG